MRLLINKFMLRHNGRLYKAGDSLELPDTLAVSLAEKSAGAYSLIDVLEDAEKEAADDVESDKDVADVLEKATTKPTMKKAGRGKK